MCAVYAIGKQAFSEDDDEEEEEEEEREKVMGDY